MKFRIDYKYKENNNAFLNAWQHNYHFVDGKDEKDAENEFIKNWTANSKLVIKEVERV